MNQRLLHALAGIVLLGLWWALSLGGLLGHADSVVRVVTGLGLVAGATLGWILQHAVHHPLTRGVLSSAGWAGAAFLLAFVLRDGILGSAGAETRLAALAAHTGLLAWGLRLLAGAAEGSEARPEGQRELLVEVDRVRLPGEVDVGAPRTPRITPLPTVREPRDPRDDTPQVGKLHVG